MADLLAPLMIDWLAAEPRDIPMSWMHGAPRAPGSQSEECHRPWRPAWDSRLRIVCTLQRCRVACSNWATAAFSLSCASEIASLTLRRPPASHPLRPVVSAPPPCGTTSMPCWIGFRYSKPWGAHRTVPAGYAPTAQRRTLSPARAALQPPCPAPRDGVASAHLPGSLVRPLGRLRFKPSGAAIAPSEGFAHGPQQDRPDRRR